jgi:hypothetical protein
MNPLVTSVTRGGTILIGAGVALICCHRTAGPTDTNRPGATSTPANRPARTNRLGRAAARRKRPPPRKRLAAARGSKRRGLTSGTAWTPEQVTRAGKRLLGKRITVTGTLLPGAMLCQRRCGGSPGLSGKRGLLGPTLLLSASKSGQARLGKFYCGGPRRRIRCNPPQRSRPYHMTGILSRDRYGIFHLKVSTIR